MQTAGKACIKGSDNNSNIKRVNKLVFTGLSFFTLYITKSSY